MKLKTKLMTEAFWIKVAAGYTDCEIISVEKHKDGWHLFMRFGDEPQERFLGKNGTDAKRYLDNEFRAEMIERDRAYRELHPHDSEAIVAKLFQPGGIYYDPNDPIEVKPPDDFEYITEKLDALTAGIDYNGTPWVNIFDGERATFAFKDLSELESFHAYLGEMLRFKQAEAAQS